MTCVRLARYTADQLAKPTRTPFHTCNVKAHRPRARTSVQEVNGDVEPIAASC